MESNVAYGKIGLIVVAVFIVVWWIKTGNRLNQFNVIIEESKKNVDIALVKRYDTISEMLKVAKSYAKHEEAVFVELVKLRQGASVPEINDAFKKQNEALRQVFAVGESYPQMLSSQQFLNLQDEIDQENEQLAAAKRVVNSNISKLNQMIVSFPASIIASSKGMRQMPFLEEESVEMKKSISDFNYDI